MAPPGLLTADEPSLQARIEHVAQARADLRPLATYRLQFNTDFSFRDAERLVPYLKHLGISHVYASPLLRARGGSTHGYDIADHNQLSTEIGGEEGFARLLSALRQHGIGLVLDTVPNHMGVGKGDNPWWQDVLRHGQASEFADFFDIDWNPLKIELRNKVLLPILGSLYGAELEAGQIQLHRGEHAFYVQYFENRLPLDPQSLPQLLTTIDHERLEPLLEQLRALPPHFETDPERVSLRQRKAPALESEVARLIAQDPQLATAVEERLRQINGTPGKAASFDDLHALLEAQPYRLAHWKVSSEEINYRRFFDVNDLVGLRMENPRVFAETHRLIRRLMASGAISGLRIDHADGLLNPRQYLIRLQMLYYAAQCCGPEPQLPASDNGIEFDVQQLLGTRERMNPAFYCVVEKILEPGESLPSEWPVEGTSGYDFIAQVNGLFVQMRNAEAFDRLYQRFLGEKLDFKEVLYDSKKVVMHTALSSEVNVLAHLLDEISSTDRHARDLTRKTLRDAIRETIACFPVYRSYIDERGEIFERDRAYILTAIARAKTRNTGTAESVFEFLRGVLLTEKPAEGPDAEYRRRLNFILKFQQLTGPVMAKGLEDTTAYVYNRFISNNEVGCLPNQFGSTVEDFHADNLRRLREWPHAMVTTSTHDTKRSGDVRARLNVLSEIPSEWSAKVSSWRRLNATHKTTLPDGRVVPSPNEEYFLYQTLVGAWPLAIEGEAEHADFIRRIQQYMDKAIHEAKLNVSWINPDPQYSGALANFIQRILAPGTTGRGNYFLNRMADFLPAVQFFGAINSLAQTLLQITSPGMPDLYQGTELFDFSLVDPDNRRPVDFGTREQLLHEMSAGVGAATLSEMLQRYADGRVKLWTTWSALRVRNEHGDVFRAGDYLPLEVSGDKIEHLCAFARTTAAKTVVTIVPRFAYTLMKGVPQPPLGEVWGRTAVLLGDIRQRTFRNALDGQQLCAVDGMLPCRDVFGNFPVALLVSED